MLPADIFAQGPASGAFRENPGFRSAAAPFSGQPVQGFSAIQFGPGGTYWVLSDNGFGSKANSPDYLLRILPGNPPAPHGPGWARHGAGGPLHPAA